MFRAKFYAASYSALSVLALAAATAPEAEAGRCHRRRAARVPRHAAAVPCAPSPAAGYAPTPQASPQGPSSAGGGPGESTASWLGHLNAVRTSRGLRPVSHDPGLSFAAAKNSEMGFNHNAGGYRRGQVVGLGPLGAVFPAWLASPSHAAILLDPGATSIGIANVGGIWTANLD